MEPKLVERFYAEGQGLICYGLGCTGEVSDEDREHCKQAVAYYLSEPGFYRILAYAPLDGQNVYIIIPENLCRKPGKLHVEVKGGIDLRV